MADQGDEFSLAFDVQAQDTKTVLLVVEGDPFDQARQTVEFCGGDFRGGRRGGRRGHESGFQARLGRDVRSEHFGASQIDFHRKN